MNFKTMLTFQGLSECLPQWNWQVLSEEYRSIKNHCHWYLHYALGCCFTISTCLLHVSLLLMCLYTLRHGRPSYNRTWKQKSLPFHKSNLHIFIYSYIVEILIILIFPQGIWPSINAYGSCMTLEPHPLQTHYTHTCTCTTCAHSGQ